MRTAAPNEPPTCCRIRAGDLRADDRPDGRDPPARGTVTDIISAQLSRLADRGLLAYGPRP
ncbi:MAG TPA: hypothetical protein VGI00_13445 [Streptosporangiaceae bacterium]